MGEPPAVQQGPQEPTRRWYHSLLLWSAVLALLAPVVLDSQGMVAAMVYLAFAASAPRIVVWLIGWSRYWFAVAQRRRLLGILTVILMVAGSLQWMARIDVQGAATEMLVPQETETVFLPPTSVLKAASLGYGGFMSDLVFIQAHTYVLNHLFGDRKFEWLDVYFDRITGLDPYNKKVYEWFAQAVKYGSYITNDSLETSNNYSRAGIERFPDHWRFYFDVGINYAVEWDTKTPEEAIAMRRKARPYFSVAAALPGSKLPPGFVAGFYGSDNEMALMHLYMNYWESSPEERVQLRANLIRLGNQANADRLARLDEAWKADKPYVPPALYEHLWDETSGWRWPVGAETSWAEYGLEE